MRIEQWLWDSAQAHPAKTAIVAGQERISYAELAAMAARLASALHSRGVQRGDRVAIFLDNCVEAAASVFGIAAAGAVFSPVNPTTKPDKLAYILNNCQARAIITHGKLMPIVQEATAQAPCVQAAILCDDPAFTPSPPHPFTPSSAAHNGIDIDLAMLIYTSGSTGVPKGVMMTHANIAAAATSITAYLANTPEDIILNVLPMSFDYGLYQLLMSVKTGATLVLEKSFTFPEVVLQKLQQEQVTGFPLVPTLAAILLQLRSLRPGSFPHLRYITNTAAALPPAHIQRLAELFPTTRIYSMYGLTECKRCTYLPPEELTRRPDSVGKAIPNTEAWVEDEEGHRAAPRTVGELVIRGPHVMQGYWQDPDATARMLRPGPNPWEKVLHTGDLFRMDDEGFLYFVGRKDDIIKTRGEKVSPKEVENVIYAMSGVKEAAIVGTPDPILGMAIKAVIVPADGAVLTSQEVQRHCAKHLEDFMIPRTVEFRPELPKTPTGKIRRRDVT